MKAVSALFRSIVLACLATLLAMGPAHAAKENIPTPSEYGVYAKTTKGLTRITTNIVYDDEEIIYMESNKPVRFPLNAVQYFIIYGKHEMGYLTLNNLKPYQMTPLGVPRFMFGIEVPLIVEKKSDVLYTVKPKGLFGRGYYALWINDSAWDFMIE